MKYLFNLALLFIALNAAAQVDYRAGYLVNKNNTTANYQIGYIVTNSNDTIKGLVDYNDPRYPSQTVIIKASADAKAATSYTPADLKGFFMVPNNTYLSYKGRISNNKNNPPNIDAVKDTTTLIAPLFLEQVVTGPNATLYTNTYKQKTRFFYKEKDRLPVEFLFYEYGNPSESPHIIPVFTSQLTELYTRYNAARNKKLQLLKNTEFTQASFQDAFYLINNTVIDDQTPLETKFFVGAGIANVTSTAEGLLGSATAKSTNISPGISLGLDLVSDPNVQKIIFRVELSFSYLKPGYTFSYTPNGINTINDNKYGFERYMASLAPQLLYNIYHTAPLKFFIGTGVSINYAFYQNTIVNYYTITSFSPTYTLSPATDNSNKYTPMEGSFLVEAGVVVNGSVELLLNYSPNITGGANVTFQSLGAGIHYLFK